MEKSKYLFSLRRIWGNVTTDKLVICQATIYQCHSPPNLDPYPLAQWQARTKYQRVQQITFKAKVTRHGAIIVRAWQRGDKIDLTSGPALQKATTRNLDYYLNHGWHGQCLMVCMLIAIHTATNLIG